MYLLRSGCYSLLQKNFKDPADGMDACCEPPDVRDDGFHALLDKNFSVGG